MKTNKGKLVMQSVKGKIHSPTMGSPYRISSEGRPMILPATGGITYNFQIGDTCMDLVGDHVEPGVSVRNEEQGENSALQILSCVGNTATVVSGEAKGEKGYVTGKHGGIEHLLVYFDDETLEKLKIDDEIQIKSWGVGLEIEGKEDIHCMNIDPDLFEKLGIVENENGELEVPVTTVIPSCLLGSGIGSATASRGDYDIMTGDKSLNKKLGLDKLRFGDIVLLEDADNTYGRQHLNGAVTIGVVVHSDCVISGHGPGVTGLLSCKTNKLKGIIDENANIANYLGVRK